DVVPAAHIAWLDTDHDAWPDSRGVGRAVGWAEVPDGEPPADLLAAFLGDPGDAPDLETTSGPAMVVHHDTHVRVLRDVAQLDVVLADTDVEAAVAPFVPDGGEQHAAVG